MVIFHGYVSLPEGKCTFKIKLTSHWPFHLPRPPWEAPSIPRLLMKQPLNKSLPPTMGWTWATGRLEVSHTNHNGYKMYHLGASPLGHNSPEYVKNAMLYMLHIFCGRLLIISVMMHLYAFIHSLCVYTIIYIETYYHISSHIYIRTWALNGIIRLT